MNSTEILEGNLLIAKFMNRSIPEVRIAKLIIPKEDRKLSTERLKQFAIRDFEDPFCYKFYSELQYGDDYQTAFKPLVVQLRNRYFLYGENGYHKSSVDQLGEIDKENLELQQAIGLKYHSSWDWLMPVVEKIESLNHPVYINSNNCVIYEKVGRNHGWFIDNYADTKIEATWISCVEFIKITSKKQ